MEAPEKIYLDAAIVAERTLAALEVALDRLQVARDEQNPGAIASAHRAAQEAEVLAQRAADAVEAARRNYWLRKAQAAEGAFVKAAYPMIAEIAKLRRAACLPADPVQHVLALLGNLSVPFAIASGDTVPAVAELQSPILDRAEDEVVHLLRGIAATRVQ